MSSACPECASVDSARAVAFHDLSVVPEEAEEGNKVDIAVELRKKKLRHRILPLQCIDIDI